MTRSVAWSMLVSVSLAGMCLMVDATSGWNGARAQGPAAPGSSSAPLTGTHLRLAATGSAFVLPDELTADLTAEAAAVSPSAAQNRVNAMMKRGMGEAAAVVGVQARAASYNVQQVDLNGAAEVIGRPRPQRPGWQASQVLELRSPPGDQLLDLVGKLQGDGFTVSSLEWRLTSGLERKSRDVAMVDALKALQGRAQAAAMALGQHVDHFQDVQVDSREVMPVRPMVALAQRAMVAPEATQSTQDITSEVTADVLLRP